MKNYDFRITRLEEGIQKILYPEETGITTIIVDKRIGETEEEKILEMENQLGRKLKKKNILLVYINNYRGKNENTI